MASSGGGGTCPSGPPLWSGTEAITDSKTDHCALYLGLQGYSFFICLLLNIDCGYSLKPLQGGGSNMYQQSMFLEEKNASYCMKH